MLGLPADRYHNMIEQIKDWIVNLTYHREELSGFSICPYAKQALSNNSYDIFESSVVSINDDIKKVDIIKNQVTIIVIPEYELYSIEALQEQTLKLNECYNSIDLVILDNDPRDPFVLNGVTTTFDKCYLWLVQSLSDLNEKHRILSKTSYYNVWTQQQLDQVVNWRK
jgi:hypothetical protein